MADKELFSYDFQKLFIENNFFLVDAISFVKELVQLDFFLN